MRRVTGSVDAPLTLRGRGQAQELKNLVGEIAARNAPNSRSRETARIVSPGAQDAEWLRPWGLGIHEGRTLSGAREDINRLISDAPDERPGVSRFSGKPGDSFNEVSARLIAGTLAQQKKLGWGRILNVTSGRAIHIIHAAALTGFQSFGKSELLGNPDFSKPGDLFKLCGVMGCLPVSDARYPGQYFAHHGETDWNEGVRSSEALREAAGDSRDELSAVILHQPVTAADSSIFDTAMGVSAEAGADSAAEQLATESPDAESFIAEYLKDAGFTRLTGQIDQTTVNRLATAIADAYEQGSGFDGIVTAVKSEFADFSATRVKAIAQTELNDAFNQSLVHFGREAGAQKKSWQTDANPCPVCIANALDGEIDFEDDFDSGDDAPPAHVNCLCSLSVHA